MPRSCGPWCCGCRLLLCCPCLWWLINIVLMFTDKPYRQGLHDKAAKTVVVSTA